MINLIKKENLNVGILETDFDVFTDIVNTFSSDTLKKDCFLDIDDYVVPEYFRNKMTIVLQTNEMLIGYVTFSFKNNNNISQAEINRLYVLDDFKNKKMEHLLIDAVVYVAGEVSCKNVLANCEEHDNIMLDIYKSLGFYEIGINENGSLLSVNVNVAVSRLGLNEMFRDLPEDYVDYKSLKLIRKLATGRSGNIYLTEDGRILKMFTSTSFTFIKDREETLRFLQKLDIKEIAKPKNLVYYDGMFVGYIMDYLPDGDALWNQNSNYSFEQRIEKIKKLEQIMKKLHEKKVYISDLNPDNIFCDEKGDIKLIDCDAFIIKKNVVNKNIASKYQDPIYKIVSEKTDLFAFAITALQIFLNIKIDDNATLIDIEKIYNKNKNKLPVSFKNYFDTIFSSSERFYLSDSYEKYFHSMYNNNDANFLADQKSGNISVIILSLILVLIAVIGYFVLKNIK